MLTQAAHFDSIAELYDESIPDHVQRHYLEKRLAFLENVIEPGSRVLDVGCGTGVLAAHLQFRGFQVEGVDVSENMLQLAAARGLRVGRSLAQSLPFGDASFDAAVSIAVLHHVADPPAVRAAIGEMVRVVRPGGVAILWDHNPLNPYWPLIMRRVPQDDGSERLVRHRELKSAFRASGASSARFQRLGFVPDFVPRRALALAQVLERVLELLPVTAWLAAHNVMVIRR